ncbi:MAG TPA: hypothetical protein VKM36_11050 [Balneolaceae bacterium]|nr:hypothetical protein [Balneolaceae bacterium]
MEHRFFQKPESNQRKILFFLGSLLFLFCLIIVLVAYLTGFYLLGALIPIAILIAAPFFDLPAGKKNGSFKYYSPFLITEPKKDGLVIFHGGTLFDYYYTLSPDIEGRERIRYVLYGYVLGFLRFISEHEKSDSEDVTIRGTSYIINPRTASRFGLEPVQKDFLQILILLFNYIPLTLSNSFLKQKLSFPKLSNVQTYEGNFEQMAAQKDELLLLKRRLQPD